MALPEAIMAEDKAEEQADRFRHAVRRQLEGWPLGWHDQDQAVRTLVDWLSRYRPAVLREEADEFPSLDDFVLLSAALSTELIDGATYGRLYWEWSAP